MAPNVTTRAKNPCSSVVINENNKRPGGWTEQEDAALAALVTKLGRKNWQQLAQHIPGRCAKSCRLRWCNQLDPSLKKDKFSEWEEAVILQGQYELGNKWASIAKLLPGRSDNAIKNHFNTTLKRKMRTRSLNNKYLQPTRTSLQALLSMGPPEAKRPRLSAPVSSAADDQENKLRRVGSPATSSTHHHQPAPNGYSSMALASQAAGRPSLVSGDHASDVQTSDSKKLPSSCSFSSLPSPASPGTSSTSSPALLHIHPDHCPPCALHPADAHLQDLHSHLRFPSPRHPHEPPAHPASRFPFHIPQCAPACPSPSPADASARLHPHRRYLVARRHTEPAGHISSPMIHPSSILEPSPLLTSDPCHPPHLPHHLGSHPLPASAPSHLGPQQQQQPLLSHHASYASSGPIPRTNSLPIEGLHHQLADLHNPMSDAPLHRPAQPASLTRQSPFSLPAAQLALSLPFSTAVSPRPQTQQPATPDVAPQNAPPSFPPSAPARPATPNPNATSLHPTPSQSIPSSAPTPSTELSYPPTQQLTPRTVFNPSLPPSTAPPSSLRPLNSAPAPLARHHTLTPLTTSDALPPAGPRRHPYPQPPLSQLPPRTTTPLPPSTLPPSTLPSRPLAPAHHLLPQHRTLTSQPSDSEAAAQLYSAWSQAPADPAAAPVGPVPSSSSSGNSHLTAAPSQQLPATSSWGRQYSSHAPLQAPPQPAPQQLTTSRQLGAGQTVLVPSNGGQVVLVGPGSSTLPAAAAPQDAHGPHQSHPAQPRHIHSQSLNDNRPPLPGLDSHRLSLGSQGPPAPGPTTSTHPFVFSGTRPSPVPTSAPPAYLPRSSTPTPAPTSLLPPAPTSTAQAQSHPLPAGSYTVAPAPQPTHASITSFTNPHPFEHSAALARPTSHLPPAPTTNPFASQAPTTQHYPAPTPAAVKAEPLVQRAPTPSLHSVLSGSFLPPTAHHHQYMLSSYNSSDVLLPGGLESGLPMSPLPGLDALPPALAGDLDLDLPDWLPMPDWTTEAVA